MINWIYEPEHAHHIGFYDGTFFYRVYMTAGGWSWEFIPEWEDAGEGYNTALEAMRQAELHLRKLEEQWERIALAELDLELELTIEELEGLEELEEAHWDTVAHERMEQAKGIGI